MSEEINRTPLRSDRKKKKSIVDYIFKRKVVNKAVGKKLDLFFNKKKRKVKLSFIQIILLLFFLVIFATPCILFQL
jgi:hypothetical protein